MKPEIICVNIQESKRASRAVFIFQQNINKFQDDIKLKTQIADAHSDTTGFSFSSF